MADLGGMLLLMLFLAPAGFALWTVCMPLLAVRKPLKELEAAQEEFDDGLDELRRQLASTGSGNVMLPSNFRFTSAAPHAAMALRQRMREREEAERRQREAEIAAAQPCFDLEMYNELKTALEEKKRFFWWQVGKGDADAAYAVADGIVSLERAIELLQSAGGTDPELEDDPYAMEEDE